MRLNGETRLDAAESADCPADRVIGIYAVSRNPEMFYFINHENPHDCGGNDRRPVAAISAAVGDDFARHGHQGAVFFNAGFNLVNHGVFPAGKRKFFLTRIGDFDRQASAFLGQQTGRKIHWKHFKLAAETAADRKFDDAHVV